MGYWLERRTYRERARGISCSSPAPASVQAEALVGDNLEHTSAPKCLRICLALDLEHVQGQQDDLADTDQATSCGVQDGLACFLAESRLKIRSIVLRQEVAGDRLAAVFVNSLEDLAV